MIVKTQPETPQRLLERYLATRDIDDRNEVVAALRHVAVLSAHRLAQSHPQAAEQVDDMIQASMVRLTEELHRYDPAKGANLHTWALPRIRGAQVDYLRSNSPETRTTLRLVTQRQQAVDTLTAQLGREPSAEEIEQHLPEILRPVVTRQIQRTLQRKPRKSQVDLAIRKIIRHRQRGTFSLSNPMSGRPDGEREVAWEHSLSVTRAGSRGATCELPDLTPLLKCLDVKTSTAMYLYFVCQQRMQDIARTMEVKESRVSQLITQGLVDLRERFPDRFAAAEVLYS